MSVPAVVVSASNDAITGAGGPATTNGHNPVESTKKLNKKKSTTSFDVVQSKKAAVIGQKADFAESTGDVAEKEADDVSVKSSSKAVQVNGVHGKLESATQTSDLAVKDHGINGGQSGNSDTDGVVKHRKAKKGGMKAKQVHYKPYPPLSGIPDERLTTRRRDREQGYRLRSGSIRFAPWNIPYRRRLQTVAVMIHCLSIASTVSCFFFLCAIPLVWPLLIPYLLHMLLSKSATDGRLRMRSERWRHLSIWKLFAEYFPAKLHKTHDLPPTRKYIFGYHPHGIISHGAFAAFATEGLGFSEKFPGITNSLLTLDSNFRIPIYRDYILAFGIQSVSKESITNILSTGGQNGEGMGRAVTIVVGGARESLEAEPHTMNLVLADRKGFVKMAIRTGADLVPVLAFGENDLYDQVSPKDHPWLDKMQKWALRTLKFTMPFLHGRGIFNYDVGLMPYRRPLNVVVGRPIIVSQRKEGEIENEEVERLHAEYVGELERMWEAYKGTFAPGRKGEMKILK
ncbi:diacylglycerol acyltransferase-domain-containing protein [Podospora fimiseda]|uniref:diacylglycerol O-acyltransferase n=1 Tax=Podospora fimiseda TaxID=252190 RepID=A0AAN7H350_9PEZI|nr:diacylglycerol acyltransferase-domain-containing protein [Podospora fimiseda]